MVKRSAQYVEHYKRGPFPGQMDAWAEAGRYFQQIHASMIDSLIDSMQDMLIEMGYEAGREVSLQIVQNRQPDIYVWQDEAAQSKAWSYAAAAEKIQFEPGTAILIEEPELDAIHIVDSSGTLVTVIEIISPRNKTNTHDMQVYQSQRATLFLRQNVNVVEIDATRSVKRLLPHALTASYPYHIGIFVPGDMPRVLVNELDQPLKKVALPLRADVIGIDPQSAYDTAYQRVAIAGKVLKETRYSADSLPFPTTLTDDQRQHALAAVDQWRTELERLQQETT